MVTTKNCRQFAQHHTDLLAVKLSSQQEAQLNSPNQKYSILGHRFDSDDESLCAWVRAIMHLNDCAGDKDNEMQSLLHLQDTNRLPVFTAGIRHCDTSDFNIHSFKHASFKVLGCSSTQTPSPNSVAHHQKTVSDCLFGPHVSMLDIARHGKRSALVQLRTEREVLLVVRGNAWPEVLEPQTSQKLNL